MNDPDAIAGVNVGGTTTSVVLGTRDGEIRARRAWPTQAQNGEGLFQAIVAAVRDLAPHATCAGVAIGGPMDARSGTVLAPPHLPGMHGFPLAARLRDALRVR